MNPGAGKTPVATDGGPAGNTNLEGVSATTTPVDKGTTIDFGYGETPFTCTSFAGALFIGYQP